MSVLSWYLRRERGLLGWHSQEDSIVRRSTCTAMQSSIANTFCQDCRYLNNGAILTLDFSPDGTLLGTASVKGTMQLFDPVCEQLVAMTPNAHYESINRLQFVDDRRIATCSDDCAVAVWDTRNLRNRMGSLQGHRECVMWMGYSKLQNTLLTSAIDGSLCTWNMSDFTLRSAICSDAYSEIDAFQLNDSADGTSVLICAFRGYLMLVRNVQLQQLEGDLGSVLLSLSEDTQPTAGCSRSENLAEVIIDFPFGNVASEYKSLQFHPAGGCILCRYKNLDETSEWSCVYDIGETYPAHVTHFIEESKGLTEVQMEASFSADGQFVCSPYHDGVRILAMDQSDTNGPTEPRSLHEIKNIQCHSAMAVCCKFSPKFPLVASGCLNGDIVWNRPVF